jgi:cytoskeletal protein RodZ
LAIVDMVLVAVLFIFLLGFFAWAVWISYLVVFRGWRIYQAPPASGADPGNSSSRSPKPTNPKAGSPRPSSQKPEESRPPESRPGRPGAQSPRSRRQGRR